MESLIAFIESKNLGIRELSRVTGISPSVISRVMNKKSTPTMETAQALLNPFGYTIAINKTGMEPIEQEAPHE